MTDSEIFPFMDTLRDVARVFPIRGDEHDLKQLGTAYFKALRRYPLAMVEAGAQRCIEQNKHFPKPAEWLDAIPRGGVTSSIEELSVAERDDWLAAERGRWEGRPCRCQECRAADVTHRPLRFVPDVSADGRDARAQIGERVVTRGHWAHGDELRRWYAAKEHFWGLFDTALAGRGMGVTRERVPGEGDL